MSGTRELRHVPRLIVHTGQGKGKSTAAFGLGLRAWAQGWSVGVFQFVKSDSWRPGEHAAYTALDEVHRTTGQGGPIEWRTLGAGRTGLRATQDVDQQSLAREGWAEVVDRLATQTHRLYILDELNHPLAKGWLDLDEVLDVLTTRTGVQHIVVTGRGAPPRLIAAADLVTDMTNVKHPFEKGERGQAGIEW
ncbi:MAG: cob(I)yrinic acid a,c-diamide adenosyltransferase [Propionibacteriaceae bacterium]